MYSALSAGHTVTHSRHPVHSTDLIDTSLSTGKDAGQAFAHFPQSMHGSVFRRIRAGLKNATIPNSAPYGHKNRHQKFGTNTEAAAKTPSTIIPVSPMCQKKFSIFASAINPYGLCMKS
jgi:hypothetical protein